jgi:hypothetical protein
MFLSITLFSYLSSYSPHASETIEIDLKGMGVAAPQAGLGFSFTGGTQMRPAYNTHDAEKMLRAPKETSYDQEFKRTVISSASDYSKSVSASAEMQASGWGASVQSKLTTSSKTTGSESLINFVAHSYVIASAPTMMDACPKLTKTASNMLKYHGETAFKMAFGSHFIYGYRAAASAMAEVMIKETSSSKRTSLAASLSASFSGFGVKASGSASFANAVREQAKNTDIQTSLTIHGVKSNPSSQNISALGDYIFDLPNVRDTTIRSRAVLYPHSFCPEYQKIIKRPLVPPPVAAGNDALLDAWAMIGYDQSSYNSIAESSAAALNALVAGKYQAQIDAINSPISKLIMSNASSELISPTALQSIRDAKTKALTIGFELSAIQDGTQPPTPKPTAPPTPPPHSSSDCDCDYHSGGCTISRDVGWNSATGTFNKCKCDYKGAWTCGGDDVSCDKAHDTNGCCSPTSTAAHRASRLCCAEGGGDCGGY